MQNKVFHWDVTPELLTQTDAFGCSRAATAALCTLGCGGVPQIQAQWAKYWQTWARLVTMAASSLSPSMVVPTRGPVAPPPSLLAQATLRPHSPARCCPQLCVRG